MSGKNPFALLTLILLFSLMSLSISFIPMVYATESDFYASSSDGFLYYNSTTSYSTVWTYHSGTVDDTSDALIVGQASIGQSMRLDKDGNNGAQNYMNVYQNFSTKNQVTGTATIFLYVDNDGTSGFDVMFYDLDALPYDYFGFTLKGDTIYNYSVGSIASYSEDQWYNITVSWDCGTDTFQFWLNEAQQGTTWDFKRPSANIDCIWIQSGGDEFASQRMYVDNVTIPTNSGSLLSDNFESGVVGNDPPGWTVDEGQYSTVEISDTQSGEGTMMWIWRSYLYFDTSSIPDTASITSANLSLYGYNDYSATDFNITVQNGQPTYPHSPLEGGDYMKGNYSGDGGYFDTSGYSVSSYNVIQLNSDGRGWINLTGVTKLCIRSSEDISGNSPAEPENQYVDFYSLEKGTIYRPKLTVLYSPTNDSASISDMDDTDNLYAQRKEYTGSSVHSHPGGYAEIDYCEFRLKQSSTTRAIFRYDEDTDTFSIQSGSSKWDLNTTSSSAVESGTSITITWKFSPQWDADVENDLEIECYVVDADAQEDTDVLQTDYVDVITDLVTTFSFDDDRGSISQSITASGQINYTGSNLYPPDGEFTSVSVYDSGNNNEGSDTSVVDGVWSITFSAPATVGTDTYNLYFNMVDADGDGEETSPTDTFITDQIKVYYEVVDDSRVNITIPMEYRVKAVLDYDETPIESGDSLTASPGALTWDAGNSWWDVSHNLSSVGSYEFSVTSGTDANYGVSSVTTNQSHPTGVWDRIRILTLTADDDSVLVGANVELRVDADLEYDSHNLGSDDNITISGVVFTWDPTDVRFEATVTSATAQGITYNTFTNGTEDTYGITAGTMDGNTITVIWFETGGGGGGGGGYVPPLPPTTTGPTPSPPEQARGFIVEYGTEMIAISFIGIFLIALIRRESPTKKKRKKGTQIRGIVKPVNTTKKGKKK